MTIKNFKPQLYPNESMDLTLVKYPVFASNKLDGIRCIFKDGKMLSRSLKEIPNKQLQEKFRILKDYTKVNKIILDGEIYALKTSFQDITHYVMTEDLGMEQLPSKIRFYCFDIIIGENGEEMPFKERYNILKYRPFENLVLVEQKIVNSKEEVEALFEEALDGEYEGLILKSMTSKYKFGRITLKSGDALKIKPFITFDAKIIGVEERFENLNESQTNELGRSFKRNTVDDKKSTGIAACFIVNYEGQEQRVMITGEESFRREIWNNKNNYIGKMIEYKGMLIGSKDKVRHPTFLRFRSDK